MSEVIVGKGLPTYLECSNSEVQISYLRLFVGWVGYVRRVLIAVRVATLKILITPSLAILAGR